MVDEPDASQEDLEAERQRREAEELASFRRRADWWSEHYGGADPDQVAGEVAPIRPPPAAGESDAAHD